VFPFRRRAPAHPATARGLVRDLTGRWLVVQPLGRTHWQLPGGRVEQGESPRDACCREVREEVGLDLPPGPLLGVGWRSRRRARFLFVFDMGTHDAAGLPVRLQASELSAWRWAAPAEALPLLKPDIAELLTTATGDGGSAVYLEYRPTGKWTGP
jgi:8-oxo-dGTP pyrophosphatase MutT (NUDIX family)